MTDNEKEKKRWPEEKSDFRSPWVWGIGTLFLLFMSVEVYMVITAIAAKPDLVTNDYYERGQSFTERSKLKSETIQKLGWEMNFTVGEIIVDEPARLSLSITSKGDAIDVGEVFLFVYRPSNAKKDFKRQMEKATEGNYQAELTFDEPGYWDVIAVARRDGKEADVARRIYVKSD